MNGRGDEAGYTVVVEVEEQGSPRSSNSNRGGEQRVVLHLGSSRKRDN